MSNGLLDQLGLGALAGFAVGVAVTSGPGDQRPIREFAREVLAECLRVVDEGRLSVAVPAHLAPALGTAAAAETPAPARRRRRTRAEIEAEAAAAAPSAPAAEEAQPRRRGRRPRAEPEPVAGAPEAAEAAAPRRRGRPRQATATTQPAAAAPEPAEAPARRRLRGQQPAAPAGAAPAPARAAAVTGAEPAPRRRGRQAAPAEAPVGGPPAPVSADGERLNINTASRAQLMRLPRIGAQAADRIIQFRESEGRIRNIRQLRQADAIPVSAARQIRDLVRF